MKPSFPSSLKTASRLFFLFAALVATSLLFSVAPTYAQGAATLAISAPKKVDVGQPISITLRVNGASDVAGYELNLRYDSTAAHFNGLHQRDNDLKKFGRGIIPLQIEQPSGGVAIGLASCNLANCVSGKGNQQTRGANGNFHLADVIIGTDQAGPLQIRFDSAKFVDAAGNPVAVSLSTPSITVQVGQGGSAHRAQPGTWQLSNRAGVTPNLSSLDHTHDNQVTYGDAMEEALGWTDARTSGDVCGNLPNASLDLNGDGCLDVSDVQIAAANSGAVKTASANAAGAPMTFIVNTTNDAADATPGNGICDATGGCTLRAAIDESNAHPGPDTIHFNIPGSGVQTIHLKTNLPTLADATGPTTIDGYTQPGASPNTLASGSNAHILIQLQGQGPSPFDGVRISSPGNVVRGLSLFNLRRSFYIFGSGATNNQIVGDFIGTDAAAQFIATTSVVNANGVGLESGAANNHVGTPALADRNVISGNSRHGIATYFEGTNNNVFQNNIIGLSPLGDRRLENLKHGVDINSASSGNLIGGTGNNERNVISGDGDPTLDNDYSAGVEISHDTATVQNKIIGNCFGTDLTCNAAPYYAHLSHYGIRFEDGVNHNEAAFNTIGNTLQGGVQIDNYNTTQNTVHDNYIGVSANGTAMPNAVFGVRVKYHGQHNTIGPNNVIAYNPTGVIIEYLDDDYNTITQNSIFKNVNMGIDLGPTIGETNNDPGDTDAGANQELNHPILNSVDLAKAHGTACGDAAVHGPCTIEIFLAEPVATDKTAGKVGQGKTLIGSGTTNDNAKFNIPVTGVKVGDLITATATDADGNTSEFSYNIAVTAAGSGTPTPTLTPTKTAQPLATPTLTPTSPPVSSPGTTPPPSATPVPPLADDSFNRAVAKGWGTADAGGKYNYTGKKANFTVNGSAGTVLIPSDNTQRWAFLPGIKLQNLDQVVRVQADKDAAGSGEIVYLVARRVNADTQYLGRLRFPPNGTVFLQSFAEVNGVLTPLGDEVTLNGVTQSPNTYLWLRFSTTGVSPTTLQLKAWLDGQPEPAGWLYTATDSTPALQTRGAIGLGAFLARGATNLPLQISFDDWRVIK